jgi:hypothetical protein
VAAVVALEEELQGQPAAQAAAVAVTTAARVVLGRPIKDLPEVPPARRPATALRVVAVAGPEALEHAVAAVTAIARSEAMEGPGTLPRLPDPL